MNRERLKMVRDRIASEPPERLDMNLWPTSLSEMDDCGTAACIGGWTDAVRGEIGLMREAGEWLGLNDDQDDHLFFPPGFGVLGRYTQAEALSALDSLINASNDDALPVWPARALGEEGA